MLDAALKNRRITLVALLCAFVLFTSRTTRWNRHPKDAPPQAPVQLPRISLLVPTSHRLKNKACRWRTQRDPPVLLSAPASGGNPGGELPWPAALFLLFPTNMRVRRLLLTHQGICKEECHVFFPPKYKYLFVCVVALCRSISTSLSLEERLEKLMEASMKVSVVGSHVLL